MFATDVDLCEVCRPGHAVRALQVCLVGAEHVHTEASRHGRVTQEVHAAVNLATTITEA